MFVSGYALFLLVLCLYLINHTIPMMATVRTIADPTDAAVGITQSAKRLQQLINSLILHTGFIASQKIS